MTHMTARMHTRRRLLVLLALLVPAASLGTLRFSRSGYRLVNGWICKADDLG